MGRPTCIQIDSSALLHNLQQVKSFAPGKSVIAMVKANAYGCGLSSVVPLLEGNVDAFGVACLEEALTIRKIGSRSDCILFQGVFSPEEYLYISRFDLQCVLHQKRQLQWLLATPLQKPIKVWIKIDTGMHRLGFPAKEVGDVVSALEVCTWIDKPLGLMTHFASADEPDNPANQAQLQQFTNAADKLQGEIVSSLANSAAIISLPKAHADVIRPGIMLYGVSPFPELTGMELGLKPVMQFLSSISAIHHYPAHSPIGYGGAWQSSAPSIIGVIPAGYGDGYPRHVKAAQVWINGVLAPIVGRISMDMLTVDLTNCPHVKEGDAVELWGSHLAVETIAQSADTIAYELLAQMTNRPRSE